MNTNVNSHSSAVGWIGIFAVVALAVVWIGSYLEETCWTWGVNTISDFGVLGKSADVFNYGIIVVGLLISVYGVGKTAISNNVGFSVAGNLIAIGGIFIAMMGLLTIDIKNGDYHKMVAMIGAILIFAGLMASAIQQYHCGFTIPVGVAILLFIAMFFCAIAFGYAKGEVYCLLIAMIWAGMDAALMIASGLKGAEQ